MQARKRAKAEAAKAALDFGKKETELMKEKARLEEEATVKAVSTSKKPDLEANMNLLTKAKDVAVDEAELQACSEGADSRSAISVPYVNRRERTEQYVFSQVRHNELNPEAEEFNHEQLPKQLIFDPTQVTVSEPLNPLPAANSQRLIVLSYTETVPIKRTILTSQGFF